MATVNHTGTIDANETWAAADEHHITGNTQIGKTGDVTQIVVTVEDNVTINWDGAYQIYGVNNSDANGLFDAVATNWANKILSRADPTTFPEPNVNSCIGLNILYNLSLNLDYYHCKNAANGIFKPAVDGAGGDAGAVTINHTVVEYCAQTVDDPADGDHSGAISVQNVLSINSGPFFGIDDLGVSLAWAGGLTVGRVYFIKPYSQHFYSSSGVAYGFNPTEWVYKGPLTYAGSIILLRMTGVPPTFTDCYFGDIVYANGMINISADIGGPLAWTNCVFNRCGQYCLQQVANQTGDDITFTDCDFLYTSGYGVLCKNGSGNGNLSNCYFYGNNNRECVEPGTAADEVQYLNVEGSITLSATPNKPLEIDNVVEGTPDTESITITFDSASGSNGDRCHGVGFIKYGTTSGAYTEETKHPLTDKELGYAWCAIKPALGSFATTGHSVTINNLKADTTYYYVCCFIDPIGRVAEGTEGNFTTTAAAGGGGGTPNVGEGGIS